MSQVIFLRRTEYAKLIHSCLWNMDLRYYKFVWICCDLILNQIILIIKPYTYFRQIINVIIYNCRRLIIKIKLINTNNKYMHNTVL